MVIGRRTNVNQKRVVSVEPRVKTAIREMEIILERVSKIGTASHQVLMCEIGYGLSFCHEEAAEAFDR